MTIQDEAAPYYSAYINLVPADNILLTLSTQLEEAMSFLSSISEEKSLYRYAPGKWTIRQLLSHVNDTERAFAFRALWFARGFDSPLPGFDQEIAAAGAQADRIAWAQHVEEFSRVRLSTISLFKNMPSDAWMKSGIASDNPFTVRALAFIVSGHVEHHMRVLREKY